LRCSHHRRRIDRVVAGTAVDEQLVGGILMHDAGGGYGDADAAVELNQTSTRGWESTAGCTGQDRGYFIRPDLADRAILLTLAPIAERQRRSEHALWREFELARPHILGAPLDAAAHGLHMLPQVRLKWLPRMADFALWATACESAFRPVGTFDAAYSMNRRDAIENVIDIDPVAALVREIMAEKVQWTGSAADLLQVGTHRSGWPKSPRALAGRLRRAQTFLRTLGIEIVFGREGRLGTRTIRITAMGENRSHNTVSTVSRVSDNGHGAGLHHPRPGLEQLL
jgi:hypothetical protein